MLPVEPSAPLIRRNAHRAEAAPFVLELFSKRAAVTRACTTAGLPACGIGFHSYSLPGCPCINLDLLLEWTQQFVLELLRCSGSRPIAWLTVPCGTFSRARLRSGAQPLRSLRYIKGCPAAMADDALSRRIRHDNALADFAMTVINLCDKLRIPWFAVGAGSSFIWDLREWSNWKFQDVTFA